MKIAILLRVCITRIHTDFKRPEKPPRMPEKIIKAFNYFEIKRLEKSHDLSKSAIPVFLNP